MSTAEAVTLPSRRRSPYVAALLSLLWPGLGHLYAGRTRAAAVFGLPQLGIALIFFVQALAGIEQLAALLIDPSSSLTIAILVVLLGVWHVVAIADSMIGFGIRNPWRRGRTALVFAALALAVLAVHGPATYVAWAFYDAGSRIFVAGNPDRTPPPASLPPGVTEDPNQEYEATPLATPQTRTSRINILLTGVDSAENRNHSLTDTILVASIDPETRQVALISFPRDISEFPLFNGGTYKSKINSLMTYARQHPDTFPDGPLPTLMKEVGYLLGAPIHYYAAVDLQGFRKMIDVVGGVTVDNPRAINDPTYSWLDGTYGFYLSAGRHKLNGRIALAYVRSRKGIGDNDFTRSRRQQQVLVALRAKITDPAMLPRLDRILSAAADTIKTNFPSDRIGEMLDLATHVDDSKTFQVVLGPPYSTHPPTSSTGGTYILRLDLERLAQLSVKIFGDASAYATK